MRDLVESVIDNLLTQERRQQMARPSTTNAAQFKQTLEGAKQRTADKQAVQQPQNEHPNQQLWKASLQFEGLFIQQMMAAMHKSVPKSDFLPHGFAQDVQNSMMDQAIAETASRRGEFGIARSIYRQMSRDNHPIQENLNIADKKIMGDPIHELERQRR